MGQTVLQIDEQRHEETTLKYTPAQIDDFCNRILDMHLTSRTEGKLLFEAVQIIRQQQEENEQLKDAILREADTMAAYAGLDDLGNDARFVKRLFLTVGDIIPELKALMDEVEQNKPPSPDK